VNSIDTGARRDLQEMRDPIFLLAPPRSYSTVSIAMLAGHPDIYGFPEMLLFKVATEGELPTIGELLSGAEMQARASSFRFARPGVTRAVAQVHEGNQSPTALRNAWEWLNNHVDWSTVRLMDHLLALVYPKIGIENSPDTVTSDRALNACLRSYPNARYIHLTRHPVTSLQSMLKHYAALYPEEVPIETRVRQHLLLWYTSHLRIVKALRGLPRGRWIRVRAEDLLGNPQSRIPGVLDWIGLPQDEHIVNVMTQTERWDFAGLKQMSGYGGGDPIFMNDPMLRSVPPPPSERMPEEWVISGAISRRISALANYLGY